MILVTFNIENKTERDVKNLTSLFHSFIHTENEFDKSLSAHLDHFKTIKGFSFYPHENLN